MVAAPALSIVFFGTPAFAAPTLEALLKSSHRVSAVVGQPDRPSGRGQKPRAGPVKMLAIEAGLPVLQPERLKDPAFQQSLAALRPDLGVVAAYGRIIPEPIIHTPRFGLINVHASLLPRYRGAAPIQRAVMAGERETGVTIMRIVKELDAGAMFEKIVRPITLDATSGDVVSAIAPPAFAFGPAWSPDGAWLAYSATSSGFKADLFISPPDGSAFYQVTFTEENEIRVEWGPTPG